MVKGSTDCFYVTEKPIYLTNPERGDMLNLLWFTMPWIWKIAQFQQQTTIWSDTIHNTNAPWCYRS